MLKSIGIAVVSFILGSGAAIGSLWYAEVGARKASSLTRSGLLALRPGMDEQEVVKLIGQPLYQRRIQQGAGKLDQWSWVYGRPGYLGGGLEMELRMSDGRLESASVELYDLGVYHCDKEQCPVVWDEGALKRLS